MRGKSAALANGLHGKRWATAGGGDCLRFTGRSPDGQSDSQNSTSRELISTYTTGQKPGNATVPTGSNRPVKAKERAFAEVRQLLAVGSRCKGFA